MTFLTGDIENLPVPEGFMSLPTTATEQCLRISELDWHEDESSWGFSQHRMVDLSANGRGTIESVWAEWNQQRQNRLAEMQGFEKANNELYLDMCGLSNELASDVPEDEITLARPDREDDVKRLMSYVIGCTMGRYSLDRTGLVYAHSNGNGFDPQQYRTFPADEDGIVPLTEMEWFEDDAANRLEKFIATAWPKEGLEENLKFVAESLGPNRGERPRETIRRYLATGFYKHHLSMYKKRPIYWLFSSGKQRAFQCLVYLHRYNEGTLARMRTEYVIPLIGKMRSRIERLTQDIERASSTSHRKTLQKEQDKLRRNWPNWPPWSTDSKAKSTRQGPGQRLMRSFDITPTSGSS